MSAVPTQAQGMLNPAMAPSKFTITRLPPSADLAFFVERYWIVQWDLRGQEPYLQENILFPCVNLVIEPGASGIFGVVTRKFSRWLEGQGTVLGIKFRPGAFYPFYRAPVSHLMNRGTTLEAVFGIPTRQLEAEALGLSSAAEQVILMESLLMAHRPEPDETVTVINAMIDTIISQRNITRVDEVAERFGWTVRGLQRLFSQYVGVGPKWVIQRYRLHDAVDCLLTQPDPDWSRLAQELGYFDQAHFIRAFKAIIGQTPAAYARSLHLMETQPRQSMTTPQ